MKKIRIYFSLHDTIIKSKEENKKVHADGL